MEQIKYKTKVLGRFGVSFENECNYTITNVTHYSIPGFTSVTPRNDCYYKAEVLSEIKRWIKDKGLSTYTDDGLSYIIFKKRNPNNSVVSVKHL